MGDPRIISVVMALLAGVAAGPASAQSTDEKPLSAIDWLSQSVAQPNVLATVPQGGATRATRVPDPDETPTARSGTAPDVSVRRLGSGVPRVLGVLPARETGFPIDLWANSDVNTLSALLQAEQIDTLPALQDLLITLSITQAYPPLEAATPGAFFLARIDKLLDFGALDPALAMLDIAGADTPATFRRLFDVSLLTGTEARACAVLRTQPDIAPTPAARIFCLARSGDWPAAALTLNTGRALGDIDADMGDLLSQFLDPELFDDQPSPTPPARVTPLTFRMFEAIGEPLSTSGLPRAFSNADLRPNAGWKAQLEAAERLARAGAISGNTLVGLYTDRDPSVSGGVYERARAVLRLDDALAKGDAAAATRAMGLMWTEARAVGVAVVLAQHFAPQLLSTPDLGAPSVRFKLLLLSAAYEEAALDPALAQTDPFAAAVARGDPSTVPPRGTAQTLVQDAFASTPDAALVAMSASGRTGEAILRAVATLQQGIDGDADAFVEGIATLRALGLEDVARRTALQYLLLA